MVSKGKKNKCAMLAIVQAAAAAAAAVGLRWRVFFIPSPRHCFAVRLHGVKLTGVGICWKKMLIFFFSLQKKLVLDG